MVPPSEDRNATDDAIDVPSAERTAETQPAGELAEGRGDVRTGLITRMGLIDVPVQFEARDGLAIFEGDIILGTVEELENGVTAAAESARDFTVGLHAGVTPGTVVDVVPQEDGAALPAGAVVVPGANFRWPLGRIPFETNANLTQAARDALNRAVDHWHQRTRLSFRARRAGDPAWLTCQDSTECSSAVGRQGGQQTVNLSANCGFGATVHELGHAVGLWHEQSREDRDQFVRVNWANIQAGKAHNFDQHISDGDDVGGYDYGSIMHYGATAFGIVDPDGRTRVTLEALRSLPPGVIMGQRAGLSVGDRAAVAVMYPSLYPDPRNAWVGRFLPGVANSLLYYAPAQQVWYLGTTTGGALTFTQVGDTSGFGNLDDGRPIWVGDFTGNGSTDVMFYYPGDDNWWLGEMSGGRLQWRLVGNTAGFGHAINDGRPFWVGDFTGNGSTDVMFYYPGDDNWWLGEMSGGQLRWRFVGNTRGFGHAINDGRPFWVGDFTGNGSTDVMFYYPGDDNWWLGTMSAGGLGWSLVGNTRGFGHRINDGRPFWVGDFTGNGSTDVMFYYPGDDNWWLGEMSGGQLRWRFVGNTRGFGHAINDGRPFWVGDFTGNGSTDVMFYYPGDDNWWLGRMDSGSLTWNLAGNTRGFGHAIYDGRPYWIGDFTGDGKADVLFHYRGDLNWWRGALGSGQFAWTLAATW
ncbi:M12 family metallopeptidase [Actinopolymorpha rutila]|uniref:Peptidase M12A domain-containing protein n=1 Tax=Actinopolymorpha rutila TaxID=446787 RepID=A0A852ZGV8_9ACTN|nr:M12 family metallopeptidase [Actinopolymorpha rutila]NYH92391.1 hypothetical protein [Actinopolymorpha rutila]